MLARLLVSLAFGFALLTPCTQASELVLAQIAPLSGPLAPTGQAYRAGINLYIASVNANGGIHGNSLKLVSVDDEYKTEQTVALARNVIREAKPIALTGVVGTGNVGALINEKILDEAGIPLIGVRTGASSLVKSSNPWLFVTRASYADEIAKILELYSMTGNSRFAVLYQNDSFGQDGLSNAERLITQFKGQLVAKASYEKNTTEVANAVKVINAASPQAVIMISNTAASAEFVKQMRAAGNVSQLTTLSTTDGPQVAAKIGAELAKGLAITQVVPAPTALSVPLSKEIQAAYKRFPNPDIALNHTMMEGYLAAKIIGEGLRKAGANPSRKQLQEAMKTIKNQDFGGLNVNFSGANQAGVQFVDITILNKEGKLLR